MSASLVRQTVMDWMERHSIMLTPEAYADLIDQFMLYCDVSPNEDRYQ